MWRFSYLMLASLLLGGCATNATGPQFSPISQAPLPAGEGRVYVLRESEPYFAQAPYVARPQIAIDGRVIGILKNGGYLASDVSAGGHALTMGFGSEPTIRFFAVPPGGAAFFGAYDKTRMEGARWTAAGAVAGATGGGIVGGAAAGLQQALEEQEEAAQRAEGRIWTLDPIPPAVALQKLQSLALSD